MKTVKPQPFRGKRVLISLVNLLMPPELQPRDEESQEHVTDLAEAIANKVKLPPLKIVTVVDDPNSPHTGNLVVDGRHTARAYAEAGKKMVPCIVRVGTWEEALVAATGANQEHTGLKRTNADKRRACELMIRELGSEWTNGRIAAHVGVSDQTVGNVRKTVAPRPKKAAAVPEAEPAAETKPETRKGADGKQYPSRPAKAPQKVVVDQIFDWKALTQEMGAVARRINGIQKQFPKFGNSAAYAGLVRLVEELTEGLNRAKEKLRNGE